MYRKKAHVLSGLLLTATLACLVGACTTSSMPVGSKLPPVTSQSQVPVFNLSWPEDLDLAVKPRLASDSSIALDGDECVEHSSNSYVDIPGQLRLVAGSGEMSWGIYGFSGILPDAGPFGLEVEQVGVLPQDCYLGVADYSAEIWRWVHITQPTGSDFISVPSNWQPVSGGGVAYFAVLTWDGQAAQVSRLILHLSVTTPPPLDLTASDGTRGDGVSLSWIDPAVSYPGLSYDAVQLERAEQIAGPYILVAVVLAGITVYEDLHDGDDNIIPYNTPVYYRVSTVIEGAPGPPGMAESGYRLLADVMGFTATTNLEDRIELNWDLVAGATDYLLEYRALAGAEPVDWTLLDTVAGLAYTHSETNPPGGFCVEKESYQYRIQARYMTDLSLGYAEALGLRNGMPVAVFSAEPLAGYPPLRVDMDATASYDSGGGSILYYDWDIDGDGTWDMSGSGNDYITYADFGNYELTLKVTDEEADMDTDSKTVHLPGWVHTWGGADDESAQAVACDPEGNIYAVGILESGASAYLYIECYTAGGGLSWTNARSVSGVNNVFINGVATDAMGNIYLSGLATTSTNGRDALLVQWHADGTPGWTRLLSTEGNDEFRGVAVDGLGNIYVTGSTRTTEGDDMVIAQYNSAGERVWAAVWNTASGNNEIGSQIAVTPGTEPLVYAVGTTNAIQAEGSIALIRLDRTGALELQTAWTCAAEYSTPAALTVDPGGSLVYIGGRFRGGATADTLLLRWSIGTGFDWQSSFTGSGSYEETIHGMAVSPDGIWLIGNTISFSNGDQIDMLLVQYNLSGLIQKTTVWNPNTNNEIYHTGCLSPDGSIVIAGSAPDITGTWHEMIGSETTLSGTTSALSGSLSTFTADHIESGLSTVVIDGVEDIGGGGRDAAVIKLGPLP